MQPAADQRDEQRRDDREQDEAASRAAVRCDGTDMWTTL